MPLKDINKPFLATIFAANLILYYGVVTSGSLAIGDLLAVLKAWPEALPAAVVAILTGVLAAQLSSDAKARIVFWRWNDPLPGSRAFTQYMQTDPRIDPDALERLFGPLPTDPKAQNRLWYQLYQTVHSEPAVVQVHREFLFTRDYAAIALLLIAVLGPLAWFTIPAAKAALMYVGILVLQYLLAMSAARKHGCRFVTTVLALKSAGK